MSTRVETADAFDWLTRQAHESMDLIITDPPYESLEKHRSKGTTTRLSKSKSSSNEWFGTIANDRLPELMAKLYSVLRKHRHCYVMCDQETLFALRPAAEGAGFKWWKALVWDKGRIGMGYHYRARHELIAFLEKGKRKLTSLSVADVLNVAPVHRGYPAEKPVALIDILVEQSSVQGETICDPFFGSGSTLVSARSKGRLPTGCDIAPAAMKHYLERRKVGDAST